MALTSPKPPQYALAFTLLLSCSASADLFNLAASSDAERTHELLRILDSDPEQINAKQPATGDTLLHVAAANGNLGLAHELMMRGASLVVRNRQQFTPHDLARHSAEPDAELVELLRPAEYHAPEADLRLDAPVRSLLSAPSSDFEIAPVGKLTPVRKRARAGIALPQRFRLAAPKTPHAMILEIMWSTLVRIRDVAELIFMTPAGLKSLAAQVDENGLPGYIELRYNRQLGYGVFATMNLPAHERLALYPGRYSLESQTATPPPPYSRYTFAIWADIWLPPQYFEGLRDAGYLRTLNTEHDPQELFLFQIDAEEEGNWSRFVNHSNEPNAYVTLCRIADPISGKLLIVPILVTKRHIGPGEQITIDYGALYWLHESPQAGIENIPFNDDLPDFG